MEELDFDKLIDAVKGSTKKSYQAHVDSNGKLYQSVANFGGKAGDIVKLERPGEYYGIAVELLTDVRQLLTDKFMIRLLTMLKKEDYVTPLEILSLNSIDQIMYIIDKWLGIATTTYDNQINWSKLIKKSYSVFDDWIMTVSHDPLPNKIKVVEIGFNSSTGNSVVPVEWIDRVFNSGYDMHKTMDKLETRIGKPPVTYAIIYSMNIQTNDGLIKDINDAKFKHLFYLDFDLNNWTFNSSMVNKIRKGYQYVKYDDLMIGFKLDDILEPKKPTGKSTKEVGLLVSRLQKAIRRGRYGAKALIETIDALNISPNYNLPEHSFLRVSSAKQMVWRLFITVLEDVRPYQSINQPDLLDLILLVLITQKIQEYKFKQPVLETIKYLAILAQYNDEPNDWYDWDSLTIADRTPISSDSFHNAIVLALNYIIMMPGDNKMLRQYYSIPKTELFEPFIRPPELKDNWMDFLSGNAQIKSKYNLSKPDVYDDIILSSYDMHVKTHIILYYQACIPISMTTKQIAGYIWNISSSYNVRSGKSHPKPDLLLKSIQQYLHNEHNEHTESTSVTKQKTVEIKKIKPDLIAKRISFLILFGQKFKSNSKDVVIAGTESTPIRVKINNEWTYQADHNLLKVHKTRIIKLSDFDPPFGFKWANTKVTVGFNSKGHPIINNHIIPFFDGSSVIESITPNITKNAGPKLHQLIMQILSGDEIEFDVLLELKNRSLSEILNWLPKKSDIKKLDFNLIKLSYTKIFNQFNNLIMIGPVTRMGQKMQNSINYLMEGKLWAVFNLFSFMYPETIRPHSTLNFYIKKETVGYVHLVSTLEQILFVDQLITGSIPTIKTKLWDHQQDSVNKIIRGFKEGHHGFGDASDVGSGKTLTSLTIAAELIKINDHTYSGILVLLPGNKLLKTWEDEINKHTKGFDIIFQGTTTNIGSIKRNTIVITTMGRARDYPISHKWLLVIIDECLTVQNKNALWTESAWVQSAMAKHLVMMSATFFRTRFDKLYYMLKMLKTGLPEQKEYLDAILLESIVSQIPKNKRKWTSKFNYFELDRTIRKEYQEIERTNLSTEAKFSKLTSFLISNSNVNELIVQQLATLIKNLEKKKRRCLIYARAMAEAELWSNGLNIPIYPKKGKHCIVTVSEGTYGLNDLVTYDTIVMRPPPPDKLPQMKGRLDRPGQESDYLYLEYFILKDTIEEGLIIRMNIASEFLHRYIMPLAQFYDVSVNYQKYLDDEDKN